MSQPPPSGSRLHLPVDTEAMRKLRHDLRTPINPILGYCELIVEEAGSTAPVPFLAGMEQLHSVGERMLKLTNGLFSNQPSPLHELTCLEILRAFRAPAGEVATLCARLEQEANAAALPVAARDLQRISIATGRWLARIEEMLEENCR
jgi:signal transduction histidine kinase